MDQIFALDIYTKFTHSLYVFAKEWDDLSYKHKHMQEWITFSQHSVISFVANMQYQYKSILLNLIAKKQLYNISLFVIYQFVKAESMFAKHQPLAHLQCQYTKLVPLLNIQYNNTIHYLFIVLTFNIYIKISYIAINVVTQPKWDYTPV